ncbi:MAG: hypothetical protein JST91_17680 [Actinobacteria bacterium]|nr:hypothetical protein [Actinomycetota bacterium]
MSDHTIAYRVRCERCLVVISIGIISAARPADDVRVTEALNELLVDYGWLPTRSGRYCRNHAAEVRGRSRRGGHPGG